MDLVRSILTVAAILAIGIACGPRSGPEPVHRLERLELQHRIRADRKRVERYRDGIHSVLGYVEARTDLLDAGDDELLSRPQREAIWKAWERLLDYYMALESIRRYHSHYWLVQDPKLRRHSFLVGYAAFLAQYSGALRFIRFASLQPDLDVLLNEPVPEVGLPARTYDQFKLRFLNVAIATQFVALDGVDKNLRNPDFMGLRKAIEADGKQLWEMGKGEGIRMTLENAGDVVRKGGARTFFPVQAGVSEWMGDTKVHRVNSSFITPEQVEALHGHLVPGDVLLERREWYLSNVGLPGYWPHAALYVGTPRERQELLAGDEKVEAWVREQGEPSGDFEKLLAARYAPQYGKHLGKDEAGHAYRVLEAISEGVSHTTLEHSADCDTLGILRPRLSRLEKARAIFNAFHYAGRPYDFDFDFRTDSALVCTELIAKAYEPDERFAGLDLPVIQVMERKVIPANLIVKQFDFDYGTPAQNLDFVAFYDGWEKGREAIPSTLEAFRSSWKRPKWHPITQDTPEPLEEAE